MSNARKVALVTGGSRGIGLGIATALAGAGFDVAINGLRDASEVRQSLQEIEQSGGASLYCRADIANLADHVALLDAIHNRFGRLDLLVNNAGVAPSVRADLLDATPESFDRLISINLRGPYFLTQAVARWMVKQREQDLSFHGCIINVSSISAKVASTNRGDYCLSKAGVAMATKLWAARLADFGIDVYEVRPGIIATDMTAGVKEKYDNLIADGLTVEKRWGTPADVGKAVTALAGGAFSYATGQVVTIDGGLTLERL